MKFSKHKRKIDLELLETMRQQACISCGIMPSDPAHVLSRGAGGPDEEFNVISLCRQCHRKQHDIGWQDFMFLYPAVRTYLENLGWDTRPDLWHPRLVSPTSP